MQLIFLQESEESGFAFGMNQGGRFLKVWVLDLPDPPFIIKTDPDQA